MESGKLTRKLGVWTAIAISVGTVIGSGIFITSAQVGQSAGSPKLAILSWLIGGLIVIPQMMVMSELSTAYPENGGGYIFIKKSGSEALAFLYGWSLFLALDPPSISILAMSLVGYLAFFVPGLTGLAAKLAAVAIVVALAFIHHRSVKAGGSLQVVLTLLKIIPFAIIIALGFLYLKGGNLSYVPQTHPSVYAGLLAGVSATSWAYVGMQNPCYMSGEFENPGKTLPRALIGSSIIVVAVYTLVAIATFGLLPFEELINSSAPLADSLKHIPSLSVIAPAFVAFAAVFVIFGSLNSCIMAQPRMQYAMAKDNLFFKEFARIHPKYETPYVSLWIQVAYACILIFLTDVVTLLGYFTIVYLLMNAIIFATIIFCRKNSDYKPIFKCPAWKLMTALAVVLTLWMAWGTFTWAPWQGTIAAIVVVATGLPVYLYWKRKNTPAMAQDSKM